MSDHERTGLEESVAVINERLRAMSKNDDERALLIRGLLCAFVLQFAVTIFMSGVKWNQVDRLVTDMRDLTTSVDELKAKRNTP